MSTDLQEIFDRAGLRAPTSGIDADVVVRRGRRVRARRRVVVGAAGVVGAGAVAGTAMIVGGAVLPAGPAQLPSGSGAGPTTAMTSMAPSTAAATPSGQASAMAEAATRAELARVSLPDPAPGFPVRRWKDGVELSGQGSAGPERWVAVFGLAARPEIVERDANGTVTGGRPAGPEVTLTVGDGTAPAQPRDSTITDATAPVRVPVAGVTGTVVTFKEKGAPRRVLTFDTGRFWVTIDGFGGVSTSQLVALGDALTGLQ